MPVPTLPLPARRSEKLNTCGNGSDESAGQIHLTGESRVCVTLSMNPTSIREKGDWMRIVYFVWNTCRNRRFQVGIPLEVPLLSGKGSTALDL